MNLGNQLRSKHLFNRTYSALPVKKFYLDLQFLVIFFPLQNTVSHTHDTICKISMVSGSCCLSRLISHHCSLAHSTPSTHLPISQVFQDTSHTGGCFCIPQTPPLNKHIFFFLVWIFNSRMQAFLSALLLLYLWYLEQILTHG